MAVRNKQDNPSKMLGLVQMSINISYYCLFNKRMGGWGRGVETHQLRWFVYEGKGAADRRAITSVTEVMFFSPPFTLHAFPALHGKWALGRQT